MKPVPVRRVINLLPFGLTATVLAAAVSSPEKTDPDDAAMSFHRTMEVREYRGHAVEGESRMIRLGDSLWRILIRERGLAEKRFGQYVVVIRTLNPQIKSMDMLRVGDTIFIPTRADDTVALGEKAADAAPVPQEAAVDSIVEYRIRRGDYVYRILREQLGIVDHRESATYYALVKDLNPLHQNWDVLEEGAVIRLPARGARSAAKLKAARDMPVPAATAADASRQIPTGSAPEPDVTPMFSEHARRLPARENLSLLEQIIKTSGSEVQRQGQEVFALEHGNVRLDRDSYPIVYNAKLQRRVIIDAEEQIPPALRRRLDAPESGASVLPLAKNVDLQEAVAQLLARLGYQPLRNDRPVVVQEGGITLETRGTWIALAPEESNKTQELLVITLTDRFGEIPGYLLERLAAKGVSLKDVVVATAAPKNTETVNPTTYGAGAKLQTWPQEKPEIIDALLLAYRIPFGVAQVQPVELRHGIQIETRTDRIFEANGRRTAVYFHRLEPEIKRTLQEKQGVRVIDLDLAALSTKEIIGALLAELGDQSAYREHRFPAAVGDQDRLSLSAWGFLVRDRSLFLTDRPIPPALQPFFFERGLDIVYFK